jgi:tol-pal system protein YbgF
MITSRVLQRIAVATLAMASSACFATREDLRVLQRDLATIRAEAIRADSAHREQLRQTQRAVAGVADTLKTVNVFLSRMQADVDAQLHAIGRQLITVQELTGQSQKRLQDLRADLEARQQDASAQAAAQAAATANSSGGAPPQVTAQSAGPAQLYQLATAQLRRGSSSSARAGFVELLAQYANDPLAADAQFGVAETYAAEANAAAADSAYAAVVSKYPKSDRAPTALYKQAMAARSAGNVRRARTLFQQIIDKYPRSDEMQLAADNLKTLK